MRPRKVLTWLMVLMGMALSVSTNVYAFAFNLGGYNGPVSIKYDLYTAECNTPVGGNGGVQPCYGNNTPAPVFTPPSVGGAPGNGFLNETTFGIGRISTIQDSSGSFDLWQAGNNGEQLLIFVYGIADLYLKSTGSNFNIYNAGCVGGSCDGAIHFDVYDVTTAAYLAASGGLGLQGFPTTNRTSFNTFLGITTGSEAVFKSELVPGLIPSPSTGFEATATLIQTVTSNTLPATGQGAWLANCVGTVVTSPVCHGVNGVNFDTNGEPNGTDFFGQFTLTDQLTQAARQNGWLGFSNDPILANTLNTPEPSVLLLFCSGLLGLVAIRRATRSKHSV